MKQTDPQFKFRLLPDLKEQLDAAAKANNRSLGAEINARLQQSFEPVVDTDPAWEVDVDERLNELRMEAVREDLAVQRQYIHLFKLRVAALKRSDEAKAHQAEIALARAETGLAELNALQERLMREDMTIAMRRGVNERRRLGLIDKAIEATLAEEHRAALRRQKEMGDLANHLGATEEEIERARDAEEEFMRQHFARQDERMFGAIRKRGAGVVTTEVTSTAEPEPRPKARRIK